MNPRRANWDQTTVRSCKIVFPWEPMRPQWIDAITRRRSHCSNRQFERAPHGPSFTCPSTLFVTMHDLPETALENGFPEQRFSSCRDHAVRLCLILDADYLVVTSS